MMTNPPYTALVDESFRRGRDGGGYFLLVAVIVPDHQHARITGLLRAHVAPGQLRWHFRDERHASRRKLLSQLAELHALDVTAVAFCCETPSQRKTEQARVRCIWNLLAELRSRDVQTVVFESRQERNDRKDRREVISAQRAGVADPALVYRHGRPKEEPLLWLPDAIAGAVGLGIANHEHELAELLPETLRQIRWIDP
jgi:hypothetical protein